MWSGSQTAGVALCAQSPRGGHPRGARAPRTLPLSCAAVDPKFSRRTSWELSPNTLSRALAARRVVGGDVVDLTITNPTAVGLTYTDSFYEGLSDAANAAYEPDPLGLESAREVIAGYYRERNCACSFDAVWLTCSTSEAFSQLLALLSDPGDAWLVPAPGYPLLDYLAALSGVRLVRYPLRFDGAWFVDLPTLEARLAEEPLARAIVCTAPGNPTGAYLREEELAAIESACAARGLALVVDEVFAEYPLGPTPGRVRCAVGPRACLTFVLSGLSKLALLPQLKLGWGVACGPHRAVESALERLGVISDAFLSVATPVQRALPRILAAAAPLRARASERLGRNLASLRAALAGSAASVLAPEAGWSAIVRLPEVGTDDEGFALALLERAGVLVHPGSLYDLAGCHAVVSLLAAPDALERGARALAAEAERIAG
jgi:alanine-synthesizing transaminase